MNQVKLEYVLLIGVLVKVSFHSHTLVDAVAVGALVALAGLKAWADHKKELSDNTELLNAFEWRTQEHLTFVNKQLEEKSKVQDAEIKAVKQEITQYREETVELRRNLNDVLSRQSVTAAFGSTQGRKV